MRVIGLANIANAYAASRGVQPVPETSPPGPTGVPICRLALWALALVIGLLLILLIRARRHHTA